MFRHWPWDKFYSHAWEFSSHIVTGIMVYTQYRLVLTGVLVLDLVTCILTLIRILQSAFICVALVERHEFAPRLYIALLFVSGTWGLAVNLAYFMLWNDSLLQPVKALFAVCIGTHDLLCLVEWGCYPILLRYRAEIAVIPWLESKLWRDSILATGRPNGRIFKDIVSHFWSELQGNLRWRQRSAIALSDEDVPLDIPFVPVTFPAQLHDDVFHWSHLIGDPSMRKALWITVDRTKMTSCAHHIYDLLPASDPVLRTILVDVTNAKTIFWPLLHALGTTWPEFKQQLAALCHRYTSLEYCYEPKADRIALALNPPRNKNHEYLYRFGYRVENLLLAPLENMRNNDQRNSAGNSDSESQRSGEMTRAVVIIHGVRDSDQAKELYDMIEWLKDAESFDVVAISTPSLLCEVSGGDLRIMDHVYTLSVSGTGTVIYSGNSPALPWLNQNLFLLVLEGIFKSADEVSESIWAELWSRAPSLSETPELGHNLRMRTAKIFHLLHEAAEDRKLILKFLSDLPVIEQSQINICTDNDNAEIAGILQRLVQDKTYKHEIPRIPEREAFSVLNLTHHILNRGLPASDQINDEKVFRRRAHRLLNVLADFLKILPEALAIDGVMLLSDRPVKYGGFADIYHGKYTNSQGEEVEVALKVLKIFQDQSDEARHILRQKFAREALVWYYLKHPNVVPFLGVDSTTFPSPTMAMVSSWMPQGSALNYMAEHSPVSRYALTLLDDVIQGLMYLHLENIVHGDLCGRNILVNERRAYLTDFGLAAFVELETSIKSSTHSGSTRWMAPELLLPDVPFKRTPASDVWAFGCVCCEVWTEGQIPFAQMSDGGVIVALSGAESSGTVPYKTKPRDKAGIPMPELLWELVQCCFKHNAAERPPVDIIADILSEIKVGKSPDTNPARIFTAVQSQFSVPTFPSSPAERHLPPTSSPSTGVQYGEVKEAYTTVRFGPIFTDEALEVEELFYGILDGLLKLIRKDVLVRPLMVEKQDAQYVHLLFRSPVDANNFAMTWIMYRYNPYKEVSVVLLDD